MIFIMLNLSYVSAVICTSVACCCVFSGLVRALLKNPAYARCLLQVDTNSKVA